MEQRKSYDKILKYSVTAKCTEPLHIGSASGAKEEVLVHPVDDIPFIQATSIAGVLGDIMSRHMEKKKQQSYLDIEGLKKKLAIKIQKKTQSMKVKFDLQMESF